MSFITGFCRHLRFPLSQIRGCTIFLLPQNIPFHYEDSIGIFRNKIFFHAFFLSRDTAAFHIRELISFSADQTIFHVAKNPCHVLVIGGANPFFHQIRRADKSRARFAYS
ncbi:MAG: hypothetical protein LUH53_00935, partial [Lachnospiraceae bacterium]|nr:hypothetical protein [Lachnospiraceae bacterium]